MLLINSRFRILGYPTFNFQSNEHVSCSILSGYVNKRLGQFLLQLFLVTISFFASAQNEVIYLWSGAITHSSARVKAKLSSNTSTARLAVSIYPDLTSPVYGPYATADSSNNRMASMSISRLNSNTLYYYGIEADGVLDNSADDIGRFRTAVAAPFSFRFLAGSCARYSNHPVFTRMAEKNPLFMLVSGDFHYANPNSATDINVHRRPYETILSEAVARDFFQKYPFVYVWDDHDFSGNNSDSSAVGKANARLAYREYIPHYSLFMGAGNQPIYHSFTMGRVHFILTDLRSLRGPGDTASTNPSISMMGTLQKQWFKQQCIYARDRNLVIAWISSVTFGGDRVDNWGGYKAEREELSNFFKNSSIKNMIIISGDAHMLALDNGKNHDFSTLRDNPNKYPVFPAAALYQSGSNKGGIYSEGKFSNPLDGTQGQYGMIDVTDLGGTEVTLTINGFRVTNTGVETTLVANKNFVMTPGAIALPVKFSSFTVHRTNKKNKLTWVVEGTDDCNRFVIEKSDDGINFENIGEITCRNENGAQTYSFTDDKPFKGNNFYRIKVLNHNATATFSGIKKIVFDDKHTVRILSQTVKDLIIVQFDLPVIEKTHYKIMNMLGQPISIGAINAGTSQFDVPLNRLKKGIYILQVYSNSYKDVCKFRVE